VDARTWIGSTSWTGKVTAHGRKWVSADGKTLSFTVDVTDAKGEPLSFLFVFDRQEPGTSR